MEVVYSFMDKPFLLCEGGLQQIRARMCFLFFEREIF